jgi:hypothetical protein
MNYVYFKILPHPDGSWIDQWRNKTLNPKNVYKLQDDANRPFMNVRWISKVEVLIEMGKGAVIEEL